MSSCEITTIRVASPQRQESPILLPDLRQPPQAASPFLRDLPVEIRLLVYRILLVKPRALRYAHEVSPWPKTGIPRPLVDVSIVSTCRTICNEAYPVLFGQNCFRFYSTTALLGPCSQRSHAANASLCKLVYIKNLELLWPYQRCYSPWIECANLFKVDWVPGQFTALRSLTWNVAYHRYAPEDWSTKVKDEIAILEKVIGKQLHELNLYGVGPRSFRARLEEALLVEAQHA